MFSHCSSTEFSDLIQPLLGLPVSRPWLGHGSAIFLELGALRESPGLAASRLDCEACISVCWDWRVEDQRRVLFGSSNSRPCIAQDLND